MKKQHDARRRESASLAVNVVPENRRRWSSRPSHGSGMKEIEGREKARSRSWTRGERQRLWVSNGAGIGASVGVCVRRASKKTVSKKTVSKKTVSKKTVLKKTVSKKTGAA